MPWTLNCQAQRLAASNALAERPADSHRVSWKLASRTPLPPAPPLPVAEAEEYAGGRDVACLRDLLHDLGLQRVCMKGEPPGPHTSVLY